MPNRTICPACGRDSAHREPHAPGCEGQTTEDWRCPQCGAGPGYGCWGTGELTACPPMPEWAAEQHRRVVDAMAAGMKARGITP